jgi:hypothetical protein
MDAIWWSILVGGLLGGLLSSLFGIYSVQGANAYSRNVFGIPSTVLITNAIVTIVAACITFLATVSGLVRDIHYPLESPMKFSIEIFLMAFSSAYVIFIMTVFRGYQITGTTFEEFSVLFAKFGLLHILLQTSGFYSYVFPPK